MTVLLTRWSSGRKLRDWAAPPAWPGGFTHIGLVEEAEHFVADLDGASESSTSAPRPLDRAPAASSVGAAGVSAQPPERLREIAGQHGEVDRLPAVLDLEAEIRHQPQVSSPSRSAVTKVPAPLQRAPEVADRAEVIADQLVEPVAPVEVDGDRGGGQGAPSSRWGTGAAPTRP
jgi:hypothetical protein